MNIYAFLDVIDLSQPFKLVLLLNHYLSFLVHKENGWGGGLRFILVCSHLKSREREREKKLL